MHREESFLVLAITLAFIIGFTLGGVVAEKSTKDQIKKDIRYCQEVRDISFHDCLHLRYFD